MESSCSRNFAEQPLVVVRSVVQEALVDFGGVTCLAIDPRNPSELSYCSPLRVGWPVLAPNHKSHMPQDWVLALS